MNVKSKNQLLAKKASEHHSNLINYGAIIALCEGGLFYGEAPSEVSKIIALAKAGMQKERVKFYKAISDIKQ